MRLCARILIASGAVLLSMGTAKLASAETFELTWTGGYGPGDAILTATYDSGDTYTVTAISGEQNGAMITALLPPYPASGQYSGNDNHIYVPGYGSADQQVDVMGLGFSVGSTDYNLWYYPPGYWECSSAVTSGCGEGNSLAVDSLEIVPTPEPNTLLLLGSGVLSVLSCRKRFLRATARPWVIRRFTT
jgi:hypothetical protein